MAGTSLLTVRGGTVTRGGRRILDHVDMHVERGQIVTLVGPNGAGKSTLIKAALGLERLDEGDVIRAPELKIGYQPQKIIPDHSLPLSVRRFLTLTQAAAEAQLRALLADVGVPHLMDASVHTLSGGEWQRVMLARAVLRRPDLLVLDEPTQNVDTAGAVEIYQIIARLRDDIGCGVLMVSHDLHVVMAATDQVYCLNGHICCSGHPSDISHDKEFQKLFGPAAATTLAIYPHAHDHSHAPDGSVAHDCGHDHSHDHYHTR
ncbi:MAG: metal ABC transporter ATP-binding protein [Rhodospirillaceae bacterium]|nr:metal ABC transporter ATP-binding protein [Rhodospirillaceae bacterium]